MQLVFEEGNDSMGTKKSCSHKWSGKPCVLYHKKFKMLWALGLLLVHSDGSRSAFLSAGERENGTCRPCGWMSLAFLRLKWEIELACPFGWISNITREE